MNFDTLYEDPKNPETLKSLVEYLKNTENMSDIIAKVYEVFPNWIVKILHRYSTDCPSLKDNWDRICCISGIKPQQIILVDYISFDTEHNIIKTLCECFTRAGFVVRRKEEFIECKKCKSALPSKQVWEKMRAASINVPKTWSDTCSEC